MVKQGGHHHAESQPYSEDDTGEARSLGGGAEGGGRKGEPARHDEREGGRHSLGAEGRQCHQHTKRQGEGRNEISVVAGDLPHGSSALAYTWSSPSRSWKCRPTET